MIAAMAGIVPTTTVIAEIVPMVYIRYFKYFTAISFSIIQIISEKRPTVKSTMGHLFSLFLQPFEVVDCLLRQPRRLDNGLVIVFKRLQPALDIVCMVGARLVGNA